MGLFEQFPYSNFHSLNLDWIIEQLKNTIDNAVLSVNGQTGEVILYQSENVVFPDVDSDQWRMVRTADGHTAGVLFNQDYMYVMYDNIADRVYTMNHPPAYPVTSVDGQTGDVKVFPDAATRLPDVTNDYTNIRRQIETNGTQNIVGIELKQDKAYRMKDTGRYEIYDSANQPPYPVTSVNGQTGVVMLAIPFTDVTVDDVMFVNAASGHEWGIGRETTDGTATIQIVTDSTKAEAYIDFFDEDGQVSYTKKLLTTDDIPSSSGVVSINGQTGVVTIYGDTMPIESGSADSVKDVTDALDTRLTTDEGTITQHGNILDTLKTMAHVGNLDTLTDGRWYADSDYVTNLPTTGHFIVDMWEFSAYTAVQLVISTQTGHMWYRNRNLGVWSGWYEATNKVKVSATGTIPSISANSYGSINIDVPVPENRSTIFTIVPRYTSLGLPIAGAYQIPGAPAGYARITVGVFNPGANAITNEDVTVDVIFS